MLTEDETREEQTAEENTEETTEETTSGETTETAEQETTEEQTAEEEFTEEKPAPRSEQVPLSKYMQEKKRRQELEKLFNQQAADREKDKLVSELIDRGWPAAEAELQASEKVRQRQEAEEVKLKLLDFEIKDLAKSDPFYSDAEAFKDEIKDKMRDLKCDAETAYMLLRGKARTREVQLQREQREQVKRKSPAATKKVASAMPEPPKSPYKLDDADKKALAELQKAQPDAKWTAEKYHKLMKT